MKKSGIPWYKRVDNLIMHLEHVIIGSGIIFITVIVLVNTLLRYIVNHSFTWAEEMSRYGVAWICFVGSASCVRFGTHAVLDVVAQALKGKARKVYDIIMNCACTVFATFLAYLGLGSLQSSIKLGNVSVLTGVPIWAIFLGVALGLILVCYNYAKTTIIDILRFNKPEQSTLQNPSQTPSIEETHNGN